MNLYIAEKPSLGRAIADALPRPHQRGDGFIKSSNGDCVKRAYTIQGRRVGYDGVLSVGRVQTPVLGLVVRRCDEIENFVSKPFYEVLAHLSTERGEKFQANWQPSEACQPYMDDSGRVLVRKLAENVVARISAKPGIVEKAERKKKRQRQPLPYSLSALQIDAGRQFGISAQQTLSACQALYEKHKLITYPRSDCRYLPLEHWSQAPSVLSAVQHNESELDAAVASADSSIKTAAWDDKRVDAHHAIIPTERKLASAQLSDHERKVYRLVARQYLAQFYPVHEYTDVRAEIVIEGGLFVATAKTTDVPGWKVLFKQKKTPEPELPQLTKGQPLTCEHGELVEKNTTPPAYFTDATLLAAMTGIARYVTSAELRKVLKETDGLGTEATRAGIIELLFYRGFMKRQGKQIHATDAGRGLIRTLPAEASEPDMTAHWESTLNAISQRASSYDEFMLPLVERLREMVAGSVSVTPEALKGVEAPAHKKKKGGSKFSKKRPGSKKNPGSSKKKPAAK